MQAAWYESQGAARDVLVVGAMADPHPGPGEVRIRVFASGINPGDLKKRENAFGVGMPFPRVIPHSDGAGVIDEVGQGVPAARVGQRVWCFGAQTYRPFGTAVEVAFDVNVDIDQKVLALGGSVAAFATGAPRPDFPFWDLLFKNARILLLGSDDFPLEQKVAAALEANQMLADGWTGVSIAKTFPLAEIGAAHEHAESHRRGRVVVAV